MVKIVRLYYQVVTFFCGTRMVQFSHIKPRSSLCLQPRSIAWFRVWIFILFGCGFYLFYFNEPIWLHLWGVAGVGGVIMTGLNCGGHLDALFGPLFFTLRSGSVSYCFFSLLSERISTSCWKAACLPSPISSIVDACAGFSKTLLYWRLTLWRRLLLAWREFWLIA